MGPGAEFRGLVVVDGPFRLRGGKVVGAVVVAGADEVNPDYGVVTFSREVISMGYDVLAEAVPIPVRAEFFAQ